MASNIDVNILVTAQDKATSTMKSIGSTAASMGSSMASSLSRLATVGLASATAGVVAFGVSMVKSAANVQLMRTNIDTLVGSTEKGREVFKDLYEFAAKTPFETTDLVNASQTLLSFGISVDDLMPSLKMLGDVSLGNVEKFNSLALAFGQVSAKGKLQGDDLRQLVSVGFNPLQKISERTGESMDSLYAKMAAGKITFEMVAEEFKLATSEGGQFYQGMEKGSKTLTGVWSTLKDTISMVGRSLVGLNNEGEIVEGGMLDQLVTMINSLNQTLSENPDLFNNAADSVGKFAQSIGDVINFMIKHQELTKAIVIIMGALVAVIGIAAGSIPIIIGTIITVIIALFLAIRDVVNWMTDTWNQGIENWRNVFAGCRQDIDNITNWIVAAWDWVKVNVGGFLTQLLDAFKFIFSAEGMGFIVGFTARLIVETVEWFASLPGRIWTWLVNTYNTIVEWFTKSRQEATNKAQETITGVGDWFSRLPGRIRDGIVGMWDAIKEAFYNVKNNAVNWAMDVVNSVVNWFSSLPGKIKDAFWNAVKAVGGFLENFLSGASKGFSIDVVGKASGGSVSGNQPYIVGERGPELFVPSSSGTIVPNNQLAGGLVVNFYGPVNMASEIGIEETIQTINRQVSLAQQGVA